MPTDKIPLMFRLQIDTGQGVSREVHLAEGALTLGRAPDCDVVIDDAVLSRKHLRFTIADGSLLVEDLGSSNGTLLNGVLVSEPTAVTEGDVLRASRTEITVSKGEAPAPPARPAAEAPPVPEAGGVTVLRPLTQLLPSEPAPAAGAGDDAALRRYADRLKLLTELHRALGESITTEDLLELVLDGAFRHLRPEGAIVLLDGGDGLEVAARRPETDAGSAPPVSATLVAEVVEKRQAALAVDVRSDERFSAAESILASGALSLCAAPLVHDEECFGMIALSSGLQVKVFDEEDLELLAALASVTALRLRSIALAEDAAERQRLESELDFARRLQMSLLPKALPEVDGYSVAARNEASRGVSGDYYQAAEVDGGALLLIADVCGKGMGASLLAASLEATCSALIEAGVVEPAAILEGASQALYQRTPPDRFATAFLVAAAAEPGRVVWVNAGHNPPLVFRAGGEVEELEATGFPLGMVPGSEYEPQELDLEAGDLLMMFTDGIVEAEDPAGEQFQLDRLVALVIEHSGEPLDAIADAIDAALDDFAAGTPFSDDRTVVMLRREAS